MSMRNFKETHFHGEMTEKSYDETDKPPHSYHVTYLDLGIILYSIIFHFIDVGYDIYVAHAYYTTEKYSHFFWTVAFILVPSLVLTLISIRMYVDDNKGRVYSKHSVIRIVLCALGFIFQLALPIRYIDSFWYAVKSLKAEYQTDRKQQEKHYLKMLNEDSDVALLKVFECYTESAPQLVLRITLLVTDYIEGSYVHTAKQIGFITLGFLALGLCMANYHRCIRFDQEKKKNISALGTTVQFLWHSNFTVSRIMAISGLAILYTLWTCVAVLIHWCIMTVWVIVSSQTHFCGKNKIFEFFFNAAGGIVYIFNFLNMKEGSTKKSYLFFYTLCFLENIAAATIWGLKCPNLQKTWIYYIFIISPIVCFLLSVGFLLLYYQCLHPNKLKPNTENNEGILYFDNKQDNAHDQRITFNNELNK